MDPITRKEMFLAKAGGQSVRTPNPITREEMFLQKIAENGGSGVAQPDWNAAEGKPGHVLNRTHYEEDAFEPIYWDGSTEGRDTIDVTALNMYGLDVFYKISDHAITVDELAEIYGDDFSPSGNGFAGKGYGYEINTDMGWYNIMILEDSDGVSHDGWFAPGVAYLQLLHIAAVGGSAYSNDMALLFVHQAGEFNGIALPSVGTYIWNGNPSNTGFRMTRVPKITHPIDPKYLPEPELLGEIVLNPENTTNNGSTAINFNEELAGQMSALFEKVRNSNKPVVLNVIFADVVMRTQMSYMSSSQTLGVHENLSADVLMFPASGTYSRLLFRVDALDSNEESGVVALLAGGAEFTFRFYA